MYCTIFNNIPGFYPVYASSNPPPANTHPLMSNKNISRYCQSSTGLEQQRLGACVGGAEKNAEIDCLSASGVSVSWVGLLCPGATA